MLDSKKQPKPFCIKGFGCFLSLYFFRRQGVAPKWSPEKDSWNGDLFYF